MSKELIKYALIFLALVLSQVVVFNHICLFGNPVGFHLFHHKIANYAWCELVNDIVVFSRIDHRHICQHTRNECLGLHSVGGAP